MDKQNRRHRRDRRVRRSRDPKAVEIIMKCQTCVRARLRHLTWPINLGLIGLCHNKVSETERERNRETGREDRRHSALGTDGDRY